MRSCAKTAIDARMLDALEAIALTEDTRLLEAARSLADERIANIALKRERERLVRRIGEEDERLSHA